MRLKLTSRPITPFVSRVETTTIGGRPAILIDPHTSESEESATAVIFPEPFGMTEIQVASMPLADLLAVAEIVAEATR